MPKDAIIPPGTSTPIAPFVPGTLADGVVYVSGTLPFDKDNNVAFPDDAEAQTRQVLETIKSVIETAGGTMEDVVMNHIFVTDWKHYGPLNKVYAEYFPGDKPAPVHPGVLREGKMLLDVGLELRDRKTAQAGPVILPRLADLAQRVVHAA